MAQMSLAHPNVSVSDFQKYVKTINPDDPPFKSVLKELQDMHIWRDGKEEKLFVDN
jgi:hypothetical protein